MAGVAVILGSVVGTLVVATFRYGAVAFLVLPAFLVNPFYWLYPVVTAVVVAMRLR